MVDREDGIHNQVAELLSAYIDDEVTAEERALVEAHLATCVTCDQDLATLRQTVDLLGQLPQAAAPRPFTLRESDVRPASAPARAWWRLPWAQGLVGAAAVLACVVVVGGAVLLRRGGMVGAPARSDRVAMEAMPTPGAANQKMAGETAIVEAETMTEAEEEAAQEAAEPPAAPPLPAEATGQLGAVEEAPVEAASVEEKAPTDEGEMLMSAESDRAAAGAAPLPTATPASVPSATPAPMATTTPAPAAEAMPAVAPSPTPTLLEVQDLSLEIEPGVIRVRGRVPLPEGRKLLATLWRDGQPIEWATLESRRLVIEAGGQFYLVLIARADIPNLDLFAAEPGDYEIRIRPVDPPAPVEIRIPIDTYGPPAPTSTSAP